MPEVWVAPNPLIVQAAYLKGWQDAQAESPFDYNFSDRLNEPISQHAYEIARQAYKLGQRDIAESFWFFQQVYGTFSCFPHHLLGHSSK